MAIDYIRVSSAPSVGSLSRFDTLASLDRQEDRHAYIRDYFSSKDSGRYFGGSNDRYFQAFESSIMNHVRSATRSTRKIRDALALTTEEDTIRPCTTERALRVLPPSMYRAILSMPEMYNKLRLGGIQGWGELKADDIEQDVAMYDRILNRNGKLKMRPNLKQDREQFLVYSSKPGDPILTAQQILDIDATRDFVQGILDNTDLDPTDLDMSIG